MYSPKFNSVLVEIDDKDAEWGGENNAEMLGKSYSKGTVVSLDKLLSTHDHPLPSVSFAKSVHELKGKQIMWNEGAEAGTTFEEGGKLYGFIYWFDIRGVKE